MLKAPDKYIKKHVFLLNTKRSEYISKYARSPTGKYIYMSLMCELCLYVCFINKSLILIIRDIFIHFVLFSFFGFSCETIQYH